MGIGPITKEKRSERFLNSAKVILPRNVNVDIFLINKKQNFLAIPIYLSLALKHVSIKEKKTF